MLTAFVHGARPLARMVHIDKTRSGDFSHTSHGPQAVAGVRPRAYLNRLLPTEREQRSYTIRFLIGAGNCLAALLALEFAVFIGISPHPSGVHALALCGFLVELTFYVLLRNGLNRRFADPSLTEYQINAAIVFIGVGYWLVTPLGKSIPLVLLIVVLMFGMFSTTPRQLGRCCVWAMAVMSTSFFLVARTAPAAIITTQQWFHVALLMMVLPTVYALAYQLALIRARLRERKEELKAALQRIETLATIDMLTGLLNRREMHNVLDRQEKMASRTDQGFCVCMIDIDFFKKVNDVHGHNMGDEVLRVFASTARSALRETDVISRWGGEEFLVMMMDTDVALARSVIERVRSDMDAVAVPTPDGQPLKVTFSAGLARYRQGEPMDRVIERADRALYHAKSAGRNQTMLDHVETVS